MKVLALASYPVEAAATRYRIMQFIAPLRERGIEVKVRPFMNSQLFLSLYKREELPHTAAGLTLSALRRLGDVVRACEADVLFIQREAMMVGPPVIEWLSSRALRRPMVLDLDDATYVSYTSPTYGRLGSALKWFSKTDDLISWARVVTCGNRAIADYVSGKGVPAVVIPTVVDTDVFRPRRPGSRSGVPVLGWIGTHSTFPYLETIFPVLERLAKKNRFRLKVVGAGRREVRIPGVEVQNLEWNLAREVEDFQSIDIGLYPIVADNWAAGKSGFKAVQYMSIGIPFVGTPVGATGEMGEPGCTHFNAKSEEDWYEALSALLADEALRQRMGEAGRAHALAHYTLDAQAAKLDEVLRRASSL